MSRTQQASLPILIDHDEILKARKKSEAQEELRLEDPKRNPKRFNPRIAKLCEVALKQLKKGD